MKLIWSPAVTLDGFIARLGGDSDWVSERDSELFQQLVRECGCVIVGRTSFDQYKGDVFPVNDAMTFVWTHHPETSGQYTGVTFISGEPKHVLYEIEKSGYVKAVLAGGGQTNSAFVGAGLVDEIRMTIYPMLFGEGIRLLSSEQQALRLQMLSTEEINDDIIQIIYSVLK